MATYGYKYDVLLRRWRENDDSTGGPPGSPITEIPATSFPPATPGVLDSFDITDIRTVNWVIVVEDATATEYNTLTMQAIHDNSVVISQALFDVGDDIDYTVSIGLVGSDIELTITANGANTLSVKAVRTVV